jgi:hypothetical protein
MAIKHKNIEVSAKKPLFGGQSEMDKAVEKWTSEGWTLTNTTASSRKNYYLLSFEYEPKEDEAKSGSSSRGVGCAVALGVIVAIALVCNVINSGSLGKESDKSTPVAHLETQRPIKPTQAPSKSLSNQVPTPTFIKPDITLTPTVIPTRKLPTATPQPTVVLAVAKSGTINARSCASTDCSIVGTIASSQKVNVIGREDNWYLVELDDNKSGYVRSDLLVLQQSSEVANLPTPIATKTPSATAFKYSGSESQDAELIQEYLDILTDGREIDSVRVVDGRANGGERGVIIAYITVESSDSGFIEEIFDIYEAVYEAIDYYDMDMDAIALVAGEKSGKAAGMVSVSAHDLLAYFNGKISKQEFIEKLTSTAF